MQRYFFVLLFMTAVATAAPTTIDITSSKGKQLAAIATAAGGPGYAVVWEEMTPPDKVRHIAAAIISDAGKFIVAPTRLLDGAPSPNEIAAVWNGTSFTIVVCNEEWNKNPKMVWGQFAVDGTFTKSGEQSFQAASQLSCRVVLASSDRVDVIVTSEEMGFNSYDEITSHVCKSWRVTLASSHAIIGKPGKVCEAKAADAQWYVGLDTKHRPMFVNGKNKVITPKNLNMEHAVASVRGKFALLDEGPRGELAYVWAEQPFKKFPHPVVFPSGPIGSIQQPVIVVTQGGGLLVAASTPSGLTVALYRGDTSLEWSGTPATQVQHLACTGNSAGTAALCVWTDEDKKFMGDVHAILIPTP